MAFCIDLIGPCSHGADPARIWKIGGKPPTAFEKDLYKAAYDRIQHKMSPLETGRCLCVEVYFGGVGGLAASSWKIRW